MAKKKDPNLVKSAKRGKPGFITRAPDADERARLRNQGASRKAHLRAQRRKPTPKPSLGARIASKARDVTLADYAKIKARRKAGIEAKAARKTAMTKAGFVGRQAIRVGRVLTMKPRKLLYPVAAWAGAEAVGAMSGLSHAKTHAKTAKKAGYKVTIGRRPFLRALVGASPDIKVKYTGVKEGQYTPGAGPPGVPRSRYEARR